VGCTAGIGIKLGGADNIVSPPASTAIYSAAQLDLVIQHQQLNCLHLLDTSLLFQSIFTSSLSTQLSNFKMSSPKPLTGKVALVTGASRGIGKAIALKLASDGAKVVVNYAGNAAAAEEVVKQIGSEQAVAIKANAGSVSEITTLIDTIVQKFGKLDILVACAGIMPLNELEKVTEEEFDSIFNLNVKGPMFLAQVS
jgi:methylmalonyl-CoA mutase cobalamin-binding subunit